MTNEEAIEILEANRPDPCYQMLREAVDFAVNALKAQDVTDTNVGNNGDTIYRQDAIDALYKMLHDYFWADDEELDTAIATLNDLPSAQPEITVDGYADGFADGYKQGQKDAQPEPEKYEYHYDHTDCIWYRPEARNRCPVTCAQYRDGWNDAMNYIFRDGKGYKPYRRDKQYGE